MRISRMLALAALAMIGLAARAEQVDNPAFGAWTKFAVGSNATLSGSIEAGERKMQMEMTQKLAEKADDKVTIETTATMEMMGQKHATPARKQEIKAKTEKADITEIGSEKVEAAGKTFDCKVYEMKNPDPQSQGKAKAWISSEVPGGLVKMEANGPQGKMSYTLKSFEVK